MQAAISSLPDGGSLVTLEGELDHHSAGHVIEEVENRIAVRPPVRLVMDFKGVTFMDSSGIALVLAALKSMRRIGGVLQIRNVPPQPARIFRTAGVDRMLEINNEMQPYGR